MTLLWIWAALLVVAQVEESSAAPTGKMRVKFLLYTAHLKL